MRLHALLLISFVLVSCSNKSIRDQNNFISLDEYSSELIDNGLISSNPLIIYQGDMIGLIEEVNLSKNEYKKLSKKTINFIPKGIDALQEFFGSGAENGVILIEQPFLLTRGKGFKKILLFNGKIIDHNLLNYLDVRKFKHYQYIGNVKKVNGEFVNLTIIVINE